MKDGFQEYVESWSQIKDVFKNVSHGFSFPNENYHSKGWIERGTNNTSFALSQTIILMCLCRLVCLLDVKCGFDVRWWRTYMLSIKILCYMLILFRQRLKMNLFPSTTVRFFNIIIRELRRLMLDLPASNWNSFENKSTESNIIPSEITTRKWIMYAVHGSHQCLLCVSLCCVWCEMLKCLICFGNFDNISSFVVNVNRILMKQNIMITKNTKRDSHLF